jgi:ABC-type dipeptide/oligopeptide/nickel transport system ATPase subunit
MDVEVRSLDFGYSTSTGAEWVFRDFNVNVKSGSMHPIVGRSRGTCRRLDRAERHAGGGAEICADVMLLDEPFVHLDAMSKRRMWREFETHWQLEKRTYVLVTHDIEEAVLLSDYVTVLSRATPTRVVETVEVGIGRPRTLETMTEPAFRTAVARVWDALEESAS